MLAEQLIVYTSNESTSRYSLSFPIDRVFEPY